MSQSLLLTGVTVLRQGRTALYPLTVACAAGTITGILGPNGAGKTTLLKALAGLLPHRGGVTLGTTDLTALSPGDRARLIGYLPQDQRLHWPLPVREVVRLGLLARQHRPDAGTIVDRAMTATDVRMLADRPATALSGGEQARVHLARVLAGDPAVILADEPVAALDPAHQLAVMALLRQQAAAGCTVVMVLHDLTLAARFCDQVLLLDRGRMITAAPPAEALTASRLTRLYGTCFVTGTVAGQPVILPVGNPDQASSPSPSCGRMVTTEISASAPGPAVTVTPSSSMRAV